MKTEKYQKRFYRNRVRKNDLYLACLSVKETDLLVSTDKPVDKKFLRERISFYRRQIESYIAKDNKFLTSLKPISVELRAPLIVREMSKAAVFANVGPMAAVAGAIAQFLGKDLLKRGFKEVIIENGGDIFLKTNKKRAIGIYTGRSKFFKGICLLVEPSIVPLGICTSSGTVGHSLSFGCADSVIILSKNTLLADAAATATGNLVKSKLDLQKALNFAKSIKGIEAVVIIIKDNLISWGKVKFGKRKP